MTIEFIKNQYCWDTFGGSNTTGFAFYADKLYRGQAFAEWLDSLSPETLKDVLPRLNGNYAFFVEKDGFCLAAVDPIRSFPLFYRAENGAVRISDAMAALETPDDLPADPVLVREFSANGFVLGKDTLLKGVKQIEAGEAVSFDADGKAASTDYYLYNLSVPEPLPEEKMLFSKLDAVLDRVADRLIETLDGRQVVIPLSGGFDSRLVAQMLHDHGYQNVVCFSYGGIDSAECRISKKIADSLGFEWHYMEQTRSGWKSLWEQPEIRCYFHDCNNLAVIPYVQHLLGIQLLLEQGVLNKDCIVITGNSGDFLEGKNIHMSDLEKETYSRPELCALLMRQHSILNGKKPLRDSELQQRVSAWIPVRKEAFPAEEAEQISECFNWRERQCKYVVSDERAYEAFGLEWRLPLWDLELMDFWSAVPVRDRAERKLYLRYVNDTTIGNANERTTYQKAASLIKTKLPVVASAAIFFQKIGEYFSHPYQWYGLVPFGFYLRAVFRTGGASGFSICSVITDLILKGIKKDDQNSGKAE